MASKINVTSQKEEVPENEGPETPLHDLSDAAVKELIRDAKKRGYVTHDQINTLLSSEEVNSEQLEEILSKLSEMDVNVFNGGAEGTRWYYSALARVFAQTIPGRLSDRLSRAVAAFSV